MDEEYLSFNKVIVFGDSGAGKTTLIKFLEDGRFHEQNSSFKYKFISFNYLNIVPDMA